MMDDNTTDRKRKRESTGEVKEDSVRRRVEDPAYSETLRSSLAGQRAASDLVRRSPLLGQMAASEALLRPQMNVADVMQTSFQRRSVTSSLLGSGLPSRGISDAALAESLFPSGGAFARSMQNPSLAGTRTPHSSLLASSHSFLPSYDHRNLAVGGTTPSLFSGLHGLQTNQLQPMHSLGQISAPHRLQAAVAHRQYTEDAMRRASASAFLPNQLAGSLSNESFAHRAASTFLQPQASSLRSSPTSLLSPTTHKSRDPVTLYLQCDDDSLTPYQCLARRQIQLFEASPSDADAGTQGRNRTILVGQVGIRCRHCAHLPLRERARGSTYYPSKLTGIYQAAQNMTNSHMVQYCQEVPKEVREELKSLSNKKSSAGGGKIYWSGGAKILGVIEDDHGLRFGN